MCVHLFRHQPLIRKEIRCSLLVKNGEHTRQLRLEAVHCADLIAFSCIFHRQNLPVAVPDKDVHGTLTDMLLGATSYIFSVDAVPDGAIGSFVRVFSSSSSDNIYSSKLAVRSPLILNLPI